MAGNDDGKQLREGDRFVTVMDITSMQPKCFICSGLEGIVKAVDGDEITIKVDGYQKCKVNVADMHGAYLAPGETFGIVETWKKDYGWATDYDDRKVHININAAKDGDTSFKTEIGRGSIIAFNATYNEDRRGPSARDVRFLFPHQSAITGTMVKWNTTKRFGFIKSNYVKDDLFCHYSALHDRSWTPMSGDVVLFEITKGRDPHKWQAAHVPLKDNMRTAGKGMKGQASGKGAGYNPLRHRGKGQVVEVNREVVDDQDYRPTIPKEFIKDQKPPNRHPLGQEPAQETVAQKTKFETFCKTMLAAYTADEDGKVERRADPGGRGPLTFQEFTKQYGSSNATLLWNNASIAT
eukprot:gene5271-11010_t